MTTLAATATPPQVEFKGGKVPFQPTARIAIPFWLMKSKGLQGAELDVMLLEENTERNYRVYAATVVIRPSQFCLNCGQEITNPISQQCGFGPICSAWLGIPRQDMTEEEMKAWRKSRMVETLTVIQLPIAYKNGPRAGQPIAEVRYGELRVVPVTYAAPPTPMAGDRPAPVAPPPPPKPQLTATVKGGRIHVRYPAYHAGLHAYMKLPTTMGARWGGKENPAWSVPESPRAAKALMDAFPDLVGDAQFTALCADGIVSAQSESLKEASMDELLAGLRALKTQPWRHQAVAAKFAVANKAVGLFIEQGGGKTFSAILAITQLGLMRMVVICPKNVIPTWAKEVHRHTWSAEDVQAWNAAHPDDLRTANAIKVIPLNKGSVKQRVKVAQDALRYQGDEPIMLVLNYESAWREDMAAFLTEQKDSWDLVILDECHKIKTPQSKVSIFCAELGQHAERRMALTGTPLPHSPLDAYALYRFLDKSVFGTSFAKFKHHYAVMGGYGGYQILDWQNLDELHDRMYTGIAYRVTAKEVLDLPPEHHVQVDVELSPAARKVYDELALEFTTWVKGQEIDPERIKEPDAEGEEVEGKIDAPHILARMVRLLQSTSGIGVAMVNGKETLIQVSTDKREAVQDWMEGIPWYEPIVMFVDYHLDMDNVRYVAGTADINRPVFELSGRTKECRARADVRMLWPDQALQWESEVRKGITAENQYGQWQTVAAWYAQNREHNESLAADGIRPINPATRKAWENAPIIIVQIQSGGAGVDLSMAAIAGYYNNGFSLGNHNQSLSRLLRPGQLAKHVTFYHFVTLGTIDEKIYAALTEKQAVVQQVLKDLLVAQVLPDATSKRIRKTS